jgi:hypothetical protein
MKIFIFVALKIAEIIGLGILYWILSRLGKIYISFLGSSYDGMPVWLGNILIGTLITTLLVVIVIGLFFGIRWFIRWNWNFAGKISKEK